MTAGWLGPGEIVRLEYDPRTITYRRLAEVAKAERCASVAHPIGAEQTRVAKAIYGDAIRSADGRFRSVPDVKYYLGRTQYRLVPMTAMQMLRANARVGATDSLLSPRQRGALRLIQHNIEIEWPVAINVAFDRAWKAFAKAAARVRTEKGTR